MSIKLMAAAWEMELPQTEKMVLLCLCDHANDAGVCWPSMPRVASKCSVNIRTVQRAIQSLRARGILDWEDAPGRSHKFTIDPRRIVTPGTESPPTLTTQPPAQSHPTPDTVPPKPSITIKEPPVNNRVTKPIGLSDDVWADWKRIRKRPVTKTVLARIEAQAGKLGWTVAEAITEAAERGWQGFEADWIRKETNDRQQPSNRNAAERALRIIEGGSH